MAPLGSCMKGRGVQCHSAFFRRAAGYLSMGGVSAPRQSTIPISRILQEHMWPVCYTQVTHANIYHVHVYLCAGGGYRVYVHGAKTVSEEEGFCPQPLCAGILFSCGLLQQHRATLSFLVYFKFIFVRFPYKLFSPLLATHTGHIWCAGNCACDSAARKESAAICQAQRG